MPEFTTTVTLPETVSAFFDVLNTVGRPVYRAGDLRVRLTISAPDLYDLAGLVRFIEGELAQATGQQIVIDRPEATDTDDQYVAAVNITDDVRQFFDVLTGIAVVQFNPIEDRATITLDADDEYDLANIVRDLETDLNGWFLGMPEIPRPVAV